MTARLLAMYPPPGDWPSRGACRNQGKDLFFPATRAAREQIAEAKAVCDACPVIAECDQWAMANRPSHGIWAGRTEWERRAPRQAVA